MLRLDENEIKDKGAAVIGKNTTWSNLKQLLLYQNRIEDEELDVEDEIAIEDEELDVEDESAIEDEELDVEDEIAIEDEELAVDDEVATEAEKLDVVRVWKMSSTVCWKNGAYPS